MDSKVKIYLEIFQKEREKRTEFIYKTTPQANIAPAKESIENAIKFLSNIKGVLEK
jgi:ASC-1-like (ASCH) protein